MREKRGMKVQSTHVVTVTVEELAERLGFTGTVTHFKVDAGDAVLTIEGGMLPAAPAPRIDELAPAAENRRTLMVEFTTTGDIAALAAYALEAKREIERMLARAPKPGVTATVTVR